MKLAETDLHPYAAGDGGCGTAVAEAAKHLRRKILDSELPPGTALVHSRFGRRAGLSASAFQEVLALLDQEGLARAAGPCPRYEVAQLSPLDLAEAYEVREALDSLGARLAATAGLTPQLEDRFAAAAAEMDQARSRSLDRDSFARAHAAWHLALLEASGNPSLARSTRLVRLTSHCLVWRSLPPAGQRMYGVTTCEMAVSAVDAHTRILHAIRAGDIRGAERAARRHVRCSTNFARVVGTGLALPWGQEAAG